MQVDPGAILIVDDDPLNRLPVTWREMWTGRRSRARDDLIRLAELVDPAHHDSIVDRSDRRLSQTGCQSGKKSSLPNVRCTRLDPSTRIVHRPIRPSFASRS